jgi:transposase-like protein
MRNYSDEFKAGIISRLLPPNNEYVPDVAKETGVPRDTLYAWRLKYGRGSQLLENGKAGSSGITSEQKFDIVLETASMNEAELSEYCRKNGLYPEQIKSWSKACRKANAPSRGSNDRETKRQLSKEVKQLKSELRRKEKALAETAALLVLKKKVQEIWGEPEDEK